MCCCASACACGVRGVCAAAFTIINQFVQSENILEPKLRASTRPERMDAESEVHAHPSPGDFLARVILIVACNVGASLHCCINKCNRPIAEVV
jgi:hypothetical protein